MLKRATEIQDSFTIRATDGDVGRVAQFYFDDRRWLIRYLIIDISNWSEGPNVLLPPTAVKTLNWREKILNVDLTKDQVRNCPDIHEHPPVSLQHEREAFSYLGWPFERAFEVAWEPEFQPEAGDPYLRSSKAVIGYHLNATDGAIGHLQDFVIDDQRWRVEQLVVDTRNWWHGKNVLIPTDKVGRINWVDGMIDLYLTRKQIKESPEFDASTLIVKSLTSRNSPELF
jgi:uncharacterized protein YrrD